MSHQDKDDAYMLTEDELRQMEEEQGADDYLRCMYEEAEAAGVPADWQGIDDVMDFQYNRFGDLVR